MSFMIEIKVLDCLVRNYYEFEVTRESVDYISHREGGEGCVREVIDLLRHAQGITPEIDR